MSNRWLEAIPEHLHDTARTAVSSAFGSTSVTSLQPVAGGASGALTYRVEVDGRPYLLRMETRRSPLRNPHQYACMRIAAEAGIAPPLRYADDAGGVAIIDFVVQRPLQDYPGGPAGLAAAIGKLAANLQAAGPFPVLGDYRVFLDRMLSYVRRSFAPGLLDRISRLSSAYVKLIRGTPPGMSPATTIRIPAISFSTARGYG